MFKKASNNMKVRKLKSREQRIGRNIANFIYKHIFDLDNASGYYLDFVLANLIGEFLNTNVVKNTSISSGIFMCPKNVILPDTIENSHMSFDINELEDLETKLFKFYSIEDDILFHDELFDANSKIMDLW